MAASTGPSAFWDKYIPFFYSIGAAVVILGAMGKIMHYDWAGWMLPIGLGTEVVIFVIYALQSFLRPSVEYQWEKVYPELSGEFKGELPTRSNTAAPAGLGLTAKMDDMLANAKITPDIFDGLKSSFQNLSTSVSNMGELASTTVATNEFTSKVKDASGKIGEMSSSLSSVTNSMLSMSDATKDAQEYRNQFQKISQNMGALNAVYEIELQDTNRHLKSMNSFYGNLSSAMSDMQEASKDTMQFKSELNKLTNNLASLNNVYGSMLSAMKQ
ncbi:gliding motility protein GldL [Lacihabitans sp. LS3-19]|uniref:type IX secretion system motor protein PorL/GldL n=1 Tax=Lacihabitans sp. LS3-19 TaxID=2487335 RepID=UPI0020CD91BF|nr:gliding motility protein GldL [Lacihabitans sp. LS3-19]MCP9770080.1 gliding motility protein GldL [Lacihabitans sp. LS3-19]